MLLTSFSPSEAKILLDGPRASAKEMLKLTLTDLFFRKVLQAKWQNEVWMVLIGPAFNQFALQPHERIFIAPFEKDPQTAVPLHTLARIGYAKIKHGHYAYLLLVAKSPKLDGLIERSLWDKMLGKFKVNEEGQDFGRRLHEEIAQEAEKLKTQWVIDKAKAWERIKGMNGCVMLLLSPDDPILKEIELMVLHAVDEVAQIDKERHKDIEDMMVFDAMADSFDSFGGDGDGGSDGGGDGGGDSGCGGGGCGGCGGS